MIRMTFQSGLKEKEKHFIAFKQQFGHTYEARIYNLLDFDRFCAANYPGRDTLDQDIVLGWVFLSEKAVQCLLSQPGATTKIGLRDSCFMVLMYDTAKCCP